MTTVKEENEKNRAFDIQWENSFRVWFTGNFILFFFYFPFGFFYSFIYLKFFSY